MTDKKAVDRLFEAASTGNVNGLKASIAAGVSPNERNDSGETPLHVAAEYGHLEMAQLLINAGGDVEAKCPYSERTSLHNAAQCNRLDVSRLLLDNGAHVNAIDDGRRTPLHFAAHSGHADMAELLVEHGAKLDAREMHQHTPLEMAVAGGQGHVVELLNNAGKGGHSTRITERRERINKRPPLGG